MHSKAGSLTSQHISWTMTINALILSKILPLVSLASSALGILLTHRENLSFRRGVTNVPLDRQCPREAEDTLAYILFIYI
jgi:hypothetical protein